MECQDQATAIDSKAHEYKQWLALIETRACSADDDARFLMGADADELIQTARQLNLLSEPTSPGEKFWALIKPIVVDNLWEGKGIRIPYEAIEQLQLAAERKPRTEEAGRKAARSLLAAVNGLLCWLSSACQKGTSGEYYIIGGRRRLKELVRLAEDAFNSVPVRSCDDAALSAIAVGLMNLRRHPSGGTANTQGIDTTAWERLRHGASLLGGVPVSQIGLPVLDEHRIKLWIRQQQKAEGKTSLTDDVLVEAYRRLGSVRAAATALTKQLSRRVTKDQVHRAVARAGGIGVVLDGVDSASIQRRVASQPRDRQKKFATPQKPLQIE